MFINKKDHKKLLENEYEKGFSAGRKSAEHQKARTLAGKMYDEWVESESRMDRETIKELDKRIAEARRENQSLQDRIEQLKNFPQTITVRIEE